MNTLSNRRGRYAEPENVATWALAIAQLVSWGSVYYGFSLFVVPMEHTMGWSRTWTNGALSVGLLVSGLAAYPIGAWIDRGHGRFVMVAGSILATAMLLLWSQAESLACLFVVWIGLGVAMAAILYDPVFAVVTRDYPTTFRTKITLITLVAGFASTLFIPLTQGLVSWLSWRHALIALAAINLVVCLPIHLTAVKGNPGQARTPVEKARLKSEAQASAARALHTPTFWGLSVCFTAYYAAFAALTFHLVPLLVERHVGSGLILATMAVIGPAQVAARALWFAVGRNVRPALIGIIVTISFPVSVVVLLCAGASPGLLMLFALIYGGANGMMTILRGTIVQDVMWTEGYGAVSGLLSTPSNIAKGVAPISAAALWTIHQNYLLAGTVILVVSCISAFAFVIAMWLSRDGRATRRNA
ncbi:MFS transporter [Caballeronia sp. DA-9]|uniref:MFS transporter n=1 Tax=Caballeronia sp. DA-9 TaxID=3436237 RepID=UPI003F672888